MTTIQKVYILFIVNNFMSKAMSVFVLGMMLILVGFASAGEGDTVITGIVYDASDNFVVGANVTINCNGNILSVDSESNGQYVISYNNNECPLLSSFSAIAEKDGMYGSSSGTISHELTNFDLGIADITIVPEFGFFIGMLTMISAVSVFFVVRKDYGNE